MQILKHNLQFGKITHLLSEFGTDAVLQWIWLGDTSTAFVKK